MNREKMCSSITGTRGLAACILAILFLLPSTAGAQETFSFAGMWEGSIEVPGSTLDVVLQIDEGEDLGGTYSIEVQGIDGMPLESFRVDGRSISFRLGGGIPGDPTFELELSVDGRELDGVFKQSGATLESSFMRVGGDADDRDAQEQIQSYLDSVRTAWKVPGLSVAVVQRGRTMTFVSGERDLEKGLPVTEETLFSIGSTSKAFTSTIIGMLVDEGLVEWDEPVQRYLPDFQLFDREASRTLRVRDLLNHTSGLPRHDLLWYLGSELTREDLYDRLRFLEPLGPAGQTWRYQNLMFMVAGLLAERVTGKSWEDLVEEKIFAPLGIASQTAIGLADFEKTDNRSLAYSKEEDEITQIPYRKIDAIGPAGSINASARGLVSWLQLNLGKESGPDGPLIAKSTLDFIHSPQVVMPGSASLRGMSFPLYGLGWMVSTYRDEPIVYHGGSIDGFQAEVSLLPQKGVGVAVLTNRQSALPGLIALDIVDILEFDEPYNHAESVAEQFAQLKEAAEEEEEGDGERVAGTTPSRDLKAYAGRYAHPAYDTVEVRVENGALALSYFELEGGLQHYHYDVFEFGSDQGIMSGGKVLFNGNIDGEIASLSSVMEVTLPPILFERLADTRLTDPTFLRKFVGSYNMSGQKITIRERAGALTITIPGQSPLALDPIRLEEGDVALFSIVDLASFKVRFSLEEGEQVATFLQPNGTFKAIKESE